MFRGNSLLDGSIAWCSPQLLVEVAESWFEGHFAGCGRILWKLSLFVVYLEGMNDKIFRGASSSAAELIASITLRIAKWTLLRK